MTRHTIIRGGLVLDIAGRRAEPADILVHRDRIVSIGPPGMAAPEDAAPVDASRRLLLPGLVNAHTHGHGHISKGLGDAWNLELLLNAGPYLNGSRSLEDKELVCLLGGLNMIRHGATACYDLFLELPLPSLEGLTAAARGYSQAGVRSVLAPMFADRSLYDAVPGLLGALPPHLAGIAERFRAAPTEIMLAALQTVVDGWSMPHDQSRLALAPTIPLHCSDELIVQSCRMAREHGLRLHMHLAESRLQAVSGERRYGTTLTQHVARLGLLGPDFTAAHGIWLDAEDIQRLADTGSSVAHNPGSNLRLGSGIAPVRQMLDRSVTVGIGTDGAQCSDHQNMFEALRLATSVSRVTTPDPAQWVHAAEALAMATAGSAAVLGFGELIGRLAPDYKADIVFLDLDDLNYVPLNDPLNQVAYVENGSAVESVMVDGKFVYRARRFTTVDLDAIRQKVEARALELRHLNAGTEGVAQQVEGAIAAFCIGSSRDPYHVHRLVS